MEEEATAAKAAGEGKKKACFEAGRGTVALPGRSAMSLRRTKVETAERNDRGVGAAAGGADGGDGCTPATEEVS